MTERGLAQAKVDRRATAAFAVARGRHAENGIGLFIEAAARTESSFVHRTGYVSRGFDFLFEVVEFRAGEILAHRHTQNAAKDVIHATKRNAFVLRNFFGAEVLVFVGEFAADPSDVARAGLGLRSTAPASAIALFLGIFRVREKLYLIAARTLARAGRATVDMRAADGINEAAVSGSVTRQHLFPHAFGTHLVHLEL